MKSLEARLFLAKSNFELQRIMASYSNYLSGGQFEKIVELFSNEQEDVRAEMPWGIYQGYRSLLRLYQGYYRKVLCGGQGNVLQPGVLDAHGMNTPVIAVAEDGCSARGLWVSPGMFTLKDPEGANGLQSYWCWQKIGADFIYENDTWKIWHLHVFPIWTTPFEVSWVEDHKDPTLEKPGAEFYADLPPSGVKVPKVPMPFSTFSTTDSY